MTLTYLADTWAFTLATQPTVPGSDLGPIYITVTFPDPQDTFVLDDDSITDGGTAEISIAATDIKDPSTGLQAIGWTLDSIDGAATKVGPGVFRFKLNWTLAATRSATVVVTWHFVNQTWSEKQSDGSGTPAPVTVSGDPTGNQTLIAPVTGPGTVTVTLPDATSSSAPGGLKLDPGSVLDAGIDFDDFLTGTGNPGIQLKTTSGDWVITLDTSRAITRVGTTNQYVIPILITIGTSASATVAPVLAPGGVAFSGTPTTGTKGGEHRTLTGDEMNNNRTYIDVKFAGAVGDELNELSIDGDEFTIGGFGANGISVNSNWITALGNGLFRFGLTGQFRPGAVTIDFAEDTWDDNGARGPPTNRAFTQTFSVVGATADIVHTVTDPATQEEKVVGLGGGSIGKDVINGLGYLEISFRPSSGNVLNPLSITGGELELRDAAGNLIAIGATPTRVGTSFIWRYTFTGLLAAGKYTVTFVAGSFSDSAGILNSEETEQFTVETVSSGVSNPGSNTVVDRDAFAGAGWVDVTFNAIGTAPFDPATILDDDAEITVTGNTNDRIVVLGRPILVSGSIYRYFFTGNTKATPTVALVAESWKDTAGNKVTQAQLAAAASVGTPAKGIFIDVTFTPTTGAQVDPNSVNGNEFTLTGAGTENLVALGSPMRVDATTWRYLYNGNPSTGKVTVSFAAGGWNDTAGQLRRGRRRSSSASSRRRSRSSSSCPAGSSSRPPASSTSR